MCWPLLDKSSIAAMLCDCGFVLHQVGAEPLKSMVEVDLAAEMPADLDHIVAFLCWAIRCSAVAGKDLYSTRSCAGWVALASIVASLVPARHRLCVVASFPPRCFPMFESAAVRADCIAFTSATALELYEDMTAAEALLRNTCDLRSTWCRLRQLVLARPGFAAALRASPVLTQACARSSFVCREAWELGLVRPTLQWAALFLRVHDMHELHELLEAANDFMDQFLRECAKEAAATTALTSYKAWSRSHIVTLCELRDVPDVVVRHIVLCVWQQDDDVLVADGLLADVCVAHWRALWNTLVGAVLLRAATSTSTPAIIEAQYKVLLQNKIRPVHEGHVTLELATAVCFRLVAAGQHRDLVGVWKKWRNTWPNLEAELGTAARIVASGAVDRDFIELVLRHMCECFSKGWVRVDQLSAGAARDFAVIEKVL